MDQSVHIIIIIASIPEWFLPITRIMSLNIMRYSIQGKHPGLCRNNHVTFEVSFDMLTQSARYISLTTTVASYPGSRLT